MYEGKSNSNKMMKLYIIRILKSYLRYSTLLKLKCQCGNDKFRQVLQFKKVKSAKARVRNPRVYSHKNHRYIEVIFDSFYSF